MIRSVLLLHIASNLPSYVVGLTYNRKDHYRNNGLIVRERPNENCLFCQFQGQIKSLAFLEHKQKMDPFSKVAIASYDEPSRLALDALIAHRKKLKATSKNCLLARYRRYAQILILEILLCIPAVKIFACLDLEPKF